MIKITDHKSYDPLYTLAIATKLSGIPAHSIRQYIDKGLIIPLKLNSKRHLFSKLDLIRLNHIHEQLDEQGLNIAGIKALMAQIPCWAIRNCSKRNRNKCQAYHSVTNPCWEASEKGTECRNQDCRECDVYQIAENNQNIKSYLKTLL
jgi:MerR family transcriptional regulator, heat shock protein HspR